MNGIPSGEVSASDRGLAYGDGVFRTFPVRAGRPLHWPRQYAKLASDCGALAIGAPDPEVLAREVISACAGEEAAIVKIIVTRGPARRGYAYEGGSASTRIVLADSAVTHPSARRKDGVKIRRCALRLSHQPALAGLKHLNRLENVIARAEWNDPAIAEGILLDVEGQVIGGTMTNLFIVRDGALVTPRLDRCGVAGVTRDRVIEAAEQQAIACSVGALSWEDVLDAAEVFLVNSVAGVWPVSAIEAAVRMPGPVTRLIQRALNEDDDAQVA